MMGGNCNDYHKMLLLCEIVSDKRATNQHVLNFMMFWHHYKCVIFNESWVPFYLIWYRNLSLKPITNFISSVSLDLALTWTHTDTNTHTQTHTHARMHAHTNTDTHTHHTHWAKGPYGVSTVCVRSANWRKPALTRDENQNFLGFRGDCGDTDHKNKKYSVFVVLISHCKAFDQDPNWRPDCGLQRQEGLKSAQGCCCYCSKATVELL